MFKQERDDLFISILREELLPAMGCTEPIALAYAAAKAREILAFQPERVLIQASPSIIKNVKSVIVPNTNHLKGMAAAAAAGIVAGQADKMLEVIAQVTDKQKDDISAYLASTEFKIERLDGEAVFELIITVYHAKHQVAIHIVDYHTNIVSIIKDGKTIFSQNTTEVNSKTPVRMDRSTLTIDNIYDFATTVDVSLVKDILEPQIKCNYAIAEEGLKSKYGSNIGQLLIKLRGDDVRIRARAKAAAGSDARMSGCELPVIINSGSGNQGITCSVPVIEFHRELQLPYENLLRALLISNLVAVHLKTGIGTLSAYCGVVSAAAGAGAGIAYLEKNDLQMIKSVITNTLAVPSGMICDGAKPSCAAKIAIAVEAALTAIEMYELDSNFVDGDGIVMDDVEKTIDGISEIARDGMRDTNDKIVRVMLG